MKKRPVAFGLVLGLIAAFPRTVAAAPHFSDWGPPVNLGCGVINSATNDSGEAVSKDGLSLYFGSDRAAPGAPLDIYVSQRQSVEEPWGQPTVVPNVNSAFADSVVSLSRDEHWMFFNSNRPGGFGDIDIWASYRAHVHDDFDWQPAVNVGPGVNTSGFEAGPAYFENDGGTPQLFFGRADAASNQFTKTEIWVSDQLPDGTFGTATRVTELNSPFPYGTQRPSIRFDGLEIFFYSNRPGGFGGSDLWVATRPSVDAAWDEPVNLGPTINTSAAEFHPSISGDGTTLYFAATRTLAEGGCGGFDIYATTRSKA